MGKYIFIGESSVRIFFENGRAADSQVGGLILRTACLTASSGLGAIYLSDYDNGPVGQTIVNHLKDNGVDTSCMQLSSRPNPLLLDFQGKESGYYPPMDEFSFDVTWPRIEKEDTIVFGGFIAIDPVSRTHVWQIVTYASERHARVAYIPELADSRIARVEKYMPTILENLEAADIVITLPSDLKPLSGSNDPATAYDCAVRYRAEAMAAISRTGKEVGVIPFGSAPSVGASNSEEEAITRILEQFNRNI